jgi:hypothetical protein
MAALCRGGHFNFVAALLRSLRLLPYRRNRSTVSLESKNITVILRPNIFVHRRLFC